RPAVLLGGDGSEAETQTTGMELVEMPNRMDELARLGTWMAACEGSSDPKGRDGMIAAARLYWAKEPGLPPIRANDLPIIGGRPFIQANVLRALAARSGYRVEKVDSTHESCTAVLHLHDEEIGRETFTLDQAQRAGIVKGVNWDKWPDRMLWARASKNVIVDYAPEVALGIG